MKNFANLVLVYFFWVICCCQGNQNTTTDGPCDCRIDLNELTEIVYHPMYLYGNTNQLIYPKSSDNILVLQPGDVIDVHCNGYKGLLLYDVVHHLRKMKLECVYGWNFQYNDKIIDLRNISCLERPDSTLRFTRIKCGTSGEQVDVGFILLDSIFLKQFSICFNFKLLIAEYTLSHVIPMVTWVSYGRGRERPLAYAFNTKSAIHRYYYHAPIRYTINRQIGLAEQDRSVIDEDKNVTLVRCNLVSKADFFWEFEKRAVQYYMNIVPQWTDFNKISWNIVRMCLSIYSLHRNVTLEIYSGTHGIMQLKNENETLVPIYLIDSVSNLPVPEIIWKVAYDETNKAGIALIGVNNFYERGKYTPLCNDVSWKIPWMDEKVRAYVYACTIADWHKTISKSFPNYEVKKLLGEELIISNQYYENLKIYNFASMT